MIEPLAASELLQLPRDTARTVLNQMANPETGILERLGSTRAAAYHPRRAVAKELSVKAIHTKVRWIDPIKYEEMVKAFVTDHGSITPRECRELFGLGASKAAQVEISRYLKKWSGRDGFLLRDGNPPKVRYFPVDSKSMSSEC